MSYPMVFLFLWQVLQGLSGPPPGGGITGGGGSWFLREVKIHVHTRLIVVVVVLEPHGLLAGPSGSASRQGCGVRSQWWHGWWGLGGLWLGRRPGSHDGPSARGCGGRRQQRDVPGIWPFVDKLAGPFCQRRLFFDNWSLSGEANGISEVNYFICCGWRLDQILELKIRENNAFSFQADLKWLFKIFVVLNDSQSMS